MRGHGHRNMYRLTGFPRSVRFEQSPGREDLLPAVWCVRDTGRVGRSLSPRRQRDLSETGLRDEETARLSAQRAAMEEALDVLKRRIDALRRGKAEATKK